METKIFTLNSRRKRGILSFFIPLLALFVGLGGGQVVRAQTYNFDNITISSAPTGGTPTTTTYDGTLDPNGTNPAFDPVAAGIPPATGNDLGNGSFFSLNTGSLTITAASTNISTAKPVTYSRLLYRVYLTSTTNPLPSFSALNLVQTSGSNIGNPVTFAASSNINLLTQSGVLGGGNYTLEILYNSAYTTTSRGVTTTTQFTDPSNPGGTGYKATFNVTPPPVTPAGGSTTWISNGVAPQNTDWLNVKNWSNGVPTRNSNAIIPGHASTDPFTVSPLLNDPNALYEVQTVTLQNTDNNLRALIRVGQSVTGSAPVGATLRVYGDLNNLGGGLLASVSGTNGSADPAKNSTLVLAGDAQSFILDANGNKTLTGGNQTVRGLTIVTDVAIEGTGIKGVINTIAAPNTFSFNTTTGIVRTIYDDGNFTRNTSKTANVDLKDSGKLIGENNGGFIDGVTLADRPLLAGVKQTFGNIGIDITPNRDIPSPNVNITRTIGAPFSGPVGASAAIKRQYGVSGDVNNNTVSTITFHYLNSVDELNGNPEPNLTIFKTSNNGIPFQLVGGSSDLTTQSVTQTGVGSINTVTLGDKTKPLPVTLTSFDAKRIGTDALVSWETASELNNKGYNVQVSTDGKEFRTLSFIASMSPNSMSAKSYSYTDKENNKAGIRYYRLQQVDVDGKSAFFTPRAVSFDGKVSASGMVAYPNPFTSGLRLNLNTTAAGTGTVRISDMTGRVISQRQIAFSLGNNDVELNSLSDLKNGLYLMNVSLPTGEVKTLKVVKQ